MLFLFVSLVGALSNECIIEIILYYCIAFLVFVSLQNYVVPVGVVISVVRQMHQAIFRLKGTDV